MSADRVIIQNIYELHGKVPAIREYRDRFGCLLKEAKDAVEKMADQYGWVNPYGLE